MLEKSKLTPDLIVEVKKWLGEGGISFFTKCKRDHGTVTPVISGYIPHPVHLREGMQVRNFLRGLDHCKDWVFDDFEEGWTDVIEACINDTELEDQPQSPQKT